MRRLALFATTFCMGFLAVRFADARGGGETLRMLFGRPVAKASATELLTGETKLSGPGVRVTIDDVKRSPDDLGNPNRYLVHAQDLLMVRNELFAAGAEAVAVNGERVVTTSAIRCVGPAVRVNEKPVTPPYVVTAIGEPRTLKSSLMMMGGVVDLLARMRMRVDVTAAEKIDMPEYVSSSRVNYAKRAEGRDD